jgi:hypothetical protein
MNKLKSTGHASMTRTQHSFMEIFFKAPQILCEFCLKLNALKGTVGLPLFTKPNSWLRTLKFEGIR